MIVSFKKECTGIFESILQLSEMNLAMKKAGEEIYEDIDYFTERFSVNACHGQLNKYALVLNEDKIYDIESVEAFLPILSAFIKKGTSLILSFSEREEGDVCGDYYYYVLLNNKYLPADMTLTVKKQPVEEFLYGKLAYDVSETSFNNDNLVRKLKSYNKTSGYSRVMRDAANEIERLNLLIAEAPKFFAPQYDFEGEKLDWLKKANLIKGV